MMHKYIHNLCSTGYWFEKSLNQAINSWRQGIGDSKQVILDFGCGSKPFKNMFDGIECDYHGIDVYPGGHVDIVYDGNQIPLDDESVDLVFSVSVFEHVRDLDFSLKEIERILKPGGRLIGLVPFVNHVHGTPFDFHRPTRIGWEYRLRKVFRDKSDISISAVDSRIICIGNIITAQINFVLYDLARFFKQEKLVKARAVGLTLEQGGASPESASKGLAIFYILLKLNPLNFLIGLGCYLLHLIAVQRRVEGEITSGYRFIVTKMMKD